jgi:hypothetical protein
VRRETFVRIVFEPQAKKHLPFFSRFIKRESVTPGLQRREVGGYSFCFFSLFRWLRFGKLEFEEKHSPVGQ